MDFEKAVLVEPLEEGDEGDVDRGFGHTRCVVTADGWLDAQRTGSVKRRLQTDVFHSVGYLQSSFVWRIFFFCSCFPSDSIYKRLPGTDIQARLISSH